MTTVSRTFTVSAPQQVVHDYLADFAHAVRWDPGTESCSRNGSGPVEVGASWHNVSKIAGLSTELTFTLEKLEPARLVFVGRNDTATSTETITFAPAENDAHSTVITYRNDLEFSGLAKMAAPAAKLIFEKLGNDTETQMTEVLSALG